MESPDQSAASASPKQVFLEVRRRPHATRGAAMSALLDEAEQA